MRRQDARLSLSQKRIHVSPKLGLGVRRSFASCMGIHIVVVDDDDDDEDDDVIIDPIL